MRVSKTLLLGLSVLAVTLGSSANSFAETLLLVKGNEYWTLDTNTMQTSKVVKVVTVDDSPTPPAPTPTPGPLPDLTDRGKRVRDAILRLQPTEDRHATAVKVATSLQTISKQIINGDVPQAMIPPFVSSAIAMMTVGKPEWGAVSQLIANEIAACPSPNVCAAALDECVAGILASLPDSGEAESQDELLQSSAEEYGVDIMVIVNMILQLMQFLAPFFK